MSTGTRATIVGRVAALLAAVWFAAPNPVAAENPTTQAACSPVVGQTQGHVTITYNGGCTSTLSEEQVNQLLDRLKTLLNAPPWLQEQYDAVVRKANLTDAA